MLANLICWIIAIGMMMVDNTNRQDLYIRSLLALGFILVGTLSKFADYYREVHIKAEEKNT